MNGVEVTRSISGRPCVFPFGVGHLLVAGATGSGKSTVLRYVLANLAVDSDVAIVGIDPKAIELTPWRPRLSTLAVERDEALHALLLVLRELRARRRLLDRHHLLAWDPALGPWLITVVDELAELVEPLSPDDRDAARQCLAALVSIGRLGRALGVHLIGATQRPAAEVLTGALRGQFDYRLGLRMRDPDESRMICPTSTADLTTLEAGGWSMWLPPLPARTELARAPQLPVAQAVAVAHHTAHLRPAVTAALEPVGTP